MICLKTNYRNICYIFCSSTTWTDVLRTPIFTRPWFELMNSRLWQCISSHWDAYSNHPAINDLLKTKVLPHYGRGLWPFQMHWLSGKLVNWHLAFVVQVCLGHKYYTAHVQPYSGSNAWPPDHDSTFLVTETPVLAAQPSATARTNLCLIPIAFITLTVIHLSRCKHLALRTLGLHWTSIYSLGITNALFLYSTVYWNLFFPNGNKWTQIVQSTPYLVFFLIKK